MRQAHVSPALADTIQPVIIAADSTREPGARPNIYAATTTLLGNGVDIPNLEMRNPSGSGVVAQMKTIHFQTLAYNQQNPNLLALSLAQEQALGAGSGGSRGLRMADGNPDSKAKYDAIGGAPQQSAVRWFQVTGIVGGYFWQGPLIGGTWFFWEEPSFPPLLLYPGASLYVEFFDASPLQYYCNLVWDEFPVTA